MTTNLITFQGILVTLYMKYVLERVDAWLQKNYGLRLVCRDGIRTYDKQKSIFLARYVTAANLRGRKVYDTRWWEGQLWYRIDATGTVATPGSSNHEVQGTGDAARAAVDIADSGADAGITVKNSARGRAMRAAAAELGIEPEGDNFAEGWHWLIRGINRAVPGQGGSTPAPAPAPSGGSGRPNPWSVIKGWNWNGIAAMLRGTGRYRGNNVPGPVMVTAFQRFLNEAGYSRQVFGRNIREDGQFGDESAMVTQQWLKGKWGYAGDIDAWLGGGSHSAWDRAEAANWLAFPGSRG